MATNTTNYNFKKPDESDFYSVQDQNNNWDKADAALKDLDTPTFEDYSGSTTVPDAATAINNIKSKGKLSTIVSNVKAAFKGACLIGQIVNNCVTNNAKLPLSAAQGKALMDLYTQLNSDLGVFKNSFDTALVDITPYKVSSIVGTTSICYLQKYGRLGIITIGSALLKYQKEGSNIIFTIPGYSPLLKTAIVVRGHNGNIYSGFVLGDNDMSIQLDNLPTGDLYVYGQFVVLLK
ncbi:hypothetical protein [Hungatella hathewayi]|uniref:hypothetical protein n=1 Tax=Hungatella hathewayi TaxID=154046 RepID=UPI00189DD424|nr:hypothetical protein [Hungatella hathewayi]